MPCDRIAAEYMFSKPYAGSFAEEWIRSQFKGLSQTELVRSYLEVIPKTWNEVIQILNEQDVTVIPNATSKDLVNVFSTHDIIGLLAHHVEDSHGRTYGIEFCDRLIDTHELEAIAPKRATTIHLGVCRSTQFIEPLKARCGYVRVIASQMQIEPEFFLRTFTRTVQLWRNVGGDYIERHVDVRNSMLRFLGVPE